MTDTRHENEIQRDILLWLGSQPDLRVWRQNSGAMRNPAGRLVQFGVPGQPDIMGLLLPSGRMLGVEVKSATGRQSEKQRVFQVMMERFGGLYVLARSVIDVQQAVHAHRLVNQPVST